MSPTGSGPLVRPPVAVRRPRRSEPPGPWLGADEPRRHREALAPPRAPLLHDEALQPVLAAAADHETPSRISTVAAP